VRNTLYRETASFGSSFRSITAIQSGYAFASCGFAPPPANAALADMRVRAETSDDADSIACHRVIVLARCAALAHLWQQQHESGVLVVPAAMCAAKALPYVIEYIYTDFVKGKRSHANRAEHVATALTTLGEKLLAQVPLVAVSCLTSSVS
jgi:hypothetical protein